jgi:hypothetical protein
VTAWAPVACWRWAPYPTVATYCGYPATPIVHDYGTTIVYQHDCVYHAGEPVATAEEYAAQALNIASAGPAAKPAVNEEWQSFGVFALIQGDAKEAGNLFQIAIDKDGVLRGNCYNALTDTSVPISGSVDKRTQRAAWVVGEKKDTVYETGVGNLKHPETQVLVHVGKERTQQWTRVRLEQPAKTK